MIKKHNKGIHNTWCAHNQCGVQEGDGKHVKDASPPSSQQGQRMNTARQEAARDAKRNRGGGGGGRQGTKKKGPRQGCVSMIQPAQF